MNRLLASLLLSASPALAQVVVPWAAETSSVLSTRAGDPAVVQPPAPGQEPLLVGPDSQGNGLSVWKLDGGLTQLLGIGPVTAADARGSWLVAAAPTGGLWFYRHDGLGLTLVAPIVANAAGSVAVGALPDGGLEVWVQQSASQVARYGFSPADGGALVTLSTPRALPETISGLAFDERTGRLYVGQPTLGIARLERSGSLDFLVSIDAGTLGSVVGGLDLYLSADGGALLFSGAPVEDGLAVHAVVGTGALPRGLVAVGAPDGGAERARLPSFVDVAVTPGASTPAGALVVSDGVVGNYKVVDLAALHVRFPLPPPSGAPPVVVDAGAPDAGAVDGGGGAGGGGGSSTGGGSGSAPGPQPSAQPPPSGCGCASSPLPLLPALLLLWWIRRPRP